MNAGGTFEFGFGGVSAGELAEDLIVGATKSLHASVVSAIDDTVQVVDGTLAAGSVRADGVVRFVREDGDSGGFEAVVFEQLTNRFEVGRVTDVEDGDFNAVVAGGLEFFDDSKIVFGHVTGPEEEVESDFHWEGDRH